MLILGQPPGRSGSRFPRPARSLPLPYRPSPPRTRVRSPALAPPEVRPRAFSDVPARSRSGHAARAKRWWPEPRCGRRRRAPPGSTGRATPRRNAQCSSGRAIRTAEGIGHVTDCSHLRHIGGTSHTSSRHCRTVRSCCPGEMCTGVRARRRAREGCPATSASVLRRSSRCRTLYGDMGSGAVSCGWCRSADAAPRSRKVRNALDT